MQSLACPQGWDPKGHHHKLQHLTLKCQGCLFFHTVSTLSSPSPIRRLLPVPPRHVSGCLQSKRPQLQHLEPPRPAACHAASLQEHPLVLAPQASLAALRCTKQAQQQPEHPLVLFQSLSPYEERSWVFKGTATTCSCSPGR